MQRKVIASAVALGLAASLITVPAADAAEIGAKDETKNTCPVRMTDAEQKRIEEVANSITSVDAAKALDATLVAAFPEFKKLADSFLNNPDVQKEIKASLDSGKPTETLFSFALEEVDRFEDEKRAGLYPLYLQSRMTREYPQLFKEEADSDGFLSINEVDATRESMGGLDPVSVIIDEYGLNAKEAAAARSAFAKTQAGKIWNSFGPEYVKAFNEAQNVCADGGNGTVAFPTKASESKPNDKTKPDDKTKPGNNDKDAGSSETGKIVGIIAGVLAALGLIAAGLVSFAPQLGIKLPF